MPSSPYGHPVRVIATLAVFITAAPQRGNAQQTLTLADLYRAAAVSPRASAASSLALAQHARVASARRPPDPEVQLGFMNRSLPSLAPMDPLSMTLIQVMQMLPVTGKLRLAGRIASAAADAADYRAKDVRWDVRAKSAVQFYDLYASQAQLEIARDTRRLVQDIAKVSQAMYATGSAKQADVLRAQVEVAKMTGEITRMESMRAGMAAKLAALLDMPVSTMPVTPLPALPDSLPSLDALIGEAERNRPMVEAGEKDLRAAEAGVALARKEIWPDLQLGLQYGWRSGEMGSEKMGSLMLGAVVPIFARSRQLSMRREAEAMRSMAAAELKSMRADTRGKVTELYADYTTAQNLRALYTTTVLPQAEATVTASFSAYRVGDVNLMTLLDNQMTLNRYRQELIGLDAERGKAIAELEMLLGRELFDPAARRTTR